MANDTKGVSSHPRTMGVAGLSTMFGWGKSDFDICTGTVPFEIASRHYCASATGSKNIYLFSSPEAWSQADGKPLYWGELANNSRYPLVRYTSPVCRTARTPSPSERWTGLATSGTCR